jgi:26S proteasome regulatory subunit T5
MVEPEDIKIGDMVGVQKESHIICEKLPTDYDARVKAMEMDEKPTDNYTDIGGLDKQIEELQEAIVLPMTIPEVGYPPTQGSPHARSPRHWQDFDG